MMETRSGAPALGQLDWVEQVTGQGVGARQACPSRPRRGGGYLDECIAPQLSADARLRELEEMGLPAVWLTLAHAIGYDHFMTMWRVLDAAQEMHSDSGSMIELQMRRYGSFKRFQRNRYVETLVDMGLSDTVIKDRLRVELDEELSISHIGRLTAPRRVGTR